ncbi:glycoside hydrolase family 16 protein [Agarivorans albus]|uniref:Beta-glucanase n=1 Tax=Agarivorans albus MKT 106 TaxID=1331007 RepID=R9PKJ3_AGAAL|nr:glycoside hydrolase family 16 protein [Agarivorans albus]GAD01872.1 beta-glucanase precursor [Agarivorans albus MKT 106]
MNVKFCCKVAALPVPLLLLACGSTEQAKQSEEALSQPVGSPAAYWQLVWNDEFDADEIDQRKWNVEEHCWGGGGASQQCYTKRKANIQVSEGSLKLLAKKGSFTGPSLPSGDKRVTKTQAYTSAKLSTKGKVDWRYGRVEVRAKLPQGQGTWPAIWMLPSEEKYGQWPASGEIDIVEAVNLKTPSDAKGVDSSALEDRLYGSLHYGRAVPENLRSGKDYQLPNGINPADGFHTYTVEWEEGEIRWFIDNVHYATQRQDEWYSQYRNNGHLITAEGAAPFDQAFYLGLNLDVGGSWAENANATGVDGDVFPQALEVDFVRVYQCTVERSSGKGCNSVPQEANLVEGFRPPITVAVDTQFAEGPRFSLFDDELDYSLMLNSYDPRNAMRYRLTADPYRGQVIEISKAGKAGNVHLTAPETNMNHWQEGGQLIFDLKLLSHAKGAKLLVKMDSGWPNASDYEVELPALDTWTEVRINVADLAARGNSLVSGKSVDLTKVVNLFVIEPTASMDLQIDKLRFEYPEASLPFNFSQRGLAYYFSDFGGNNSQLIQDPSKQRSRVALTRKSANAAGWAGTSLGEGAGFSQAIQLDELKPTMSLWVYSPAAAIPVRLKITDSKQPDSFAEVEVLTQSQGQWEQLIFDFSQATPSWQSDTRYNKVTLFFNYGVRGAEAGEQVFYWDQLKVGS